MTSTDGPGPGSAGIQVAVTAVWWPCTAGCGPLLEKFRCGFGPGIRVFNHDSDSLINKSRLLARRRWPGARGIGALSGGRGALPAGTFSQAASRGTVGQQFCPSRGWDKPSASGPGGAARGWPAACPSRGCLSLRVAAPPMRKTLCVCQRVHLSDSESSDVKSA